MEKINETEELIKKEIEKLEEEKKQIANKLSSLDNERNILLTRMVEIQGVIKYLTTPKENQQSNEKN